MEARCDTFNHRDEGDDLEEMAPSLPKRQAQPQPQWGIFLDAAPEPEQVPVEHMIA